MSKKKKLACKSKFAEKKNRRKQIGSPCSNFPIDRKMGNKFNFCKMIYLYG